MSERPRACVQHPFSHAVNITIESSLPPESNRLSGTCGKRGEFYRKESNLTQGRAIESARESFGTDLRLELRRRVSLLQSPGVREGRAPSPRA
jgi:hypothetical protein